MKARTSLKFIYSTTRGYRIVFMILLVCVIGNSLTTLLYPGLIGEIVDAIFYAQELDYFFKIFLLYLGVYLGNQVINCVLNYCYAYLKAGYLMSIRKAVCLKMQQVQAKFFFSFHTGDVIQRVNADVDKFLDFIHSNLFFSVSDAIHLIGSIVYISFLSKWLALICICMIPVMYYVTRYFVKILSERNRNLETKKGILAAWILEIMNGLSEVKLLNANQKMHRDYIGRSREIVDEEIAVSYQEILVQRVNVLILLAGQLVFFSFSASCIIKGTMSVGSFVAGCTYFTTCVGYYKNFINRISEAIKNTIAINRISEIMLYEEDKDEGEECSVLNGKISFLDVQFSYDSRLIFHHLSFEIEPGEHVVIVGRNGEGKSTIINLLCGFFQKSDGRICIDDVEIEKYSLKCLREKIGVVAQQSVLFDNTIRYNLIFTSDSSRDEELWEVLKRVGLFEEFQHTEHGLDTVLGTGERELSGGQKQRLVIARMLLKKPDILILDEATSAIDGESQMKIEEIIRTEYRNHTVISVAHRFSAILQADRILVLDGGRIIAHGTHEELYASCEQYRSLYEHAKVSE